MASSDKAGGYDCKFVSEPDDALKCLICLVVAKDPLQHMTCGKLFCKKCIEKYGKDKPCPNCKEPFYPDVRGRRDIQALCVKCDNADRKCKWVGTVETLEKHVAKCKFTLLPCTKECKDDNDRDKYFMRKDLKAHLEKDCPNRDYACEYCGEEDTYANITEIHDGICEYKILPCPNMECTETMQRQEIDEHIEDECEYTEISCKYETIGCDVEMQRKDMAAHGLDDKRHLHMALTTVVSIRKELQDKSATLKNGEPIKFKLTEYQKKRDNNEIVYSPSYYMYPNGYHMAIRVYANGNGDRKGTHVSVYAPIRIGNYDAELKWPLLGKVKFTLLNQLEDDNHYSETMDFTTEKNAQVGSAWGHRRFTPHSQLGHDSVKNTQYLKDNTLYFRLSVEVADNKPWL